MELPHEFEVEDLLREADWMRALARRLLDEHADDAVQDAWVIALERRDEPKHSTRAWMAAVFQNLARSRWRSDRARTQRERSNARSEALPATADVVERAEAQRRLVDAVLALDEPCRSTILLHWFDDVPAEEIARRENVAGSTIRSRLSRGLAQLRRELERKGGAQWAVLLQPLTTIGTSTSAASSITLGTIAMSIGTKIGLGVAAAVLLAWWQWPAHTNDTSPTRGGSTSSPLANVDPVHDESTQLAAIEATAVARTPLGDVAPPDGSSSVTVRVTWADDHTPASGVVVRVLPWNAPDPFVYADAVTTDLEGRARVDHVPPGKVHLICVFGGTTTVELAAGEHARASIEIPQGAVVEGSVVDMEGHAVPQASIWLSEPTNASKGELVARADAHGRFRLRSIPRASHVAACAVGFAPSPSYEVNGELGDTLRPRIVLGPRGGSLRGIVRGPNGEPVVRAVVLCGDERAYNLADVDGRRCASPPPQRARTDETGSFAFEGVAPGRIPIAARARALAPWSGRATIGVDSAEFLEITLLDDAIVHGVVRDDAGEPLSEVFVGAGSYAGFGSSQTRSAADGSFRLVGLSGGPVEIVASSKNRGKVTSRIELTPGVEHAWDPVLVRSTDVAGRVLDDSGAPLAGWLVGAFGTERPQKRSTQTDAAGAFVLPNWPSDASRIEVRDPASFLGEPVASLHDIRPSGGDVEIRVPLASRAGAWIEGSALDEKGRALEASHVWIQSVEHDITFREQPNASDGKFQLGPLPSGSYRLWFDAPQRGQTHLPVTTIEANERRDVGVITLAPAGSIRVELVAPEGMEFEHPIAAHVRSATNVPLGSISFTDGVGRMESVAPGAYIVHLTEVKVRADLGTVNVVSGAESTVVLQLERGTARQVEVEWLSDADAGGSVRLVVTDDRERVVFDSPLRMPKHSESNAARIVTVPVPVAGLRVGTYTAEATAGSGLSARVTFRVEKLAPDATPISVPLR